MSTLQTTPETVDRSTAWTPPAELRGPPGHWLLGNLREFRRGMLEFYDRIRAEYGSVVPFRLGRRPYLMLAEPDLIEDVLVRQHRRFKKHWALQLLLPVLGRGLVLSEGDFWLAQRRLIQPAFSRQLAELFAEIVVKRSQMLAEKWEREPRRDLHRDMTTLSVQIAAEAMLGAELPSDLQAVERAVDELQLDFEQRFKSVFDWPRWVPTPLNRRRERSIAVLDEVIHRIIADRKANPEPGRDALSLLVAARDEQGRGMSDRQLRDEVSTLLLAGHDTTANTLSWAWFLLSQHPQTAANVAAEADRVLNGRPATADDLPKLRYCRNVVMEVLRLYPAVYMFGREAADDVDVCGLAIRKGTNVVMSQWVMHRDARFYDDPLAFRPERWTDEFESQLPKYAYFPFGGGPRVCIGKDLAMLEGTLALATLGAKFSVRVERPETVEPAPAVTLRPNGPLRATCVSRR